MEARHREIPVAAVRPVYIVSALEEAILDQLLSFAKTLPPIPDDQCYQLICSDPVYNLATDIYEFTIKAETIQK